MVETSDLKEGDRLTIQNELAPKQIAADKNLLSPQNVTGVANPEIKE